jgi:hypothetical protein
MAASAPLRYEGEGGDPAGFAYGTFSSDGGHLGRIAEGRAAWEQTLRIDPNFSTNDGAKSCHLETQLTLSFEWKVSEEGIP